MTQTQDFLAISEVAEQTGIHENKTSLLLRAWSIPVQRRRLPSNESKLTISAADFELFRRKALETGFMSPSAQSA